MPYEESDIRDYVLDNWHFYWKNGIGWRSIEACIWHYSRNNRAFAQDLYGVDWLMLRGISEYPKGYGNDEFAARREEIAKIEMRMRAEKEATYYVENDLAYFAELMASFMAYMPQYDEGS